MKTFINEWVIPSIIAVVIVLFLNRFIFILVTVPTGSMETTIMPGDRLYVNKLFDIKDAKRGDILVFQSDELDARLVKRLIGLPGETVEINATGEVFINGEKLDEPYINNANGEERTFKIPEGTYFLGDNRPVSVDARYWSNPLYRRIKLSGRSLSDFSL